jgi:Xaa-Pro dipeptidase
MTRGAPALEPDRLSDQTIDRGPAWSALDGGRPDADSRPALPSLDGDDDQQLDGNEPPPEDDTDARATLSGRRVELVQRLLGERKAAGVLLSDRRNFSWLTVGGTAHVLQSSDEGVAPVLVTPRGAVILTSSIEADRITTEEVLGIGLPVESFDWFADGGVRAAAASRVTGPLLSDADLDAGIQPVRSVLAPLEQARMAWIADRVRDALEQALDGAEQDEPEDFLAADATMILGDAGVRAPVVLAAADGRIDRFRHPLAGRTTIQRRVMLVLVGERWGLHVAATAIRELEPPFADLRRRARGVERILAAMTDATREGATLGSVFATAQRAYKAAGFPDEWRLHHQGGTIGYAARERIAVPGDPTPIRAGMAFAWNPSITGTKVETTFILRDGGEVRILV